MRILMMSNTYTPIVGGLEKSIKLFDEAFSKRGHQVHIAVPEYKGRPATERNVTRIQAIQRFNRTDFSVNLPLSGKLEKLMDSFQPDIIHSHHPFLMGDMALRLCEQYNTPHVFTYHTMYDQYTHYLPVNNKMVKRFVVELAEGFANLCDRVIAPSDSVKEMLSTGGVNKPIDVIPTGVDTAVFLKGDRKNLRNKFNIPRHAFVLGYVGRLAPEKNLKFLAESISTFLKKEKGSYFLIIGTGVSESEMRGIFAKDSVEDFVRFSGSLSGQDLVDAYHAMDIFVFSSKSETQGMVLVEAMASGTPVIALDGPGVREIVNDKVNGRVITSEDKGEFVSALRWWLHLHDQKKRQMEDEARKTAGFFTIDRCADRMLEIYEEVKSKNHESRVLKNTPWHRMLHRIEAEWDILSNFGEAAGAALGISQKRGV
jgi:1,2-diacylglycerol 3-alpha-glucosyltransferase